MTEEEAVTRLEQAVKAKKTAENATREAFEAAVVAALNAGVKPIKVADMTGYSRETIRRIARKNHVAPLREPTVTSRKPKPGGDSPA
jgi:DNA invertase Pin-like site-specific DNA recombinase